MLKKLKYQFIRLQNIPYFNFFLLALIFVLLVSYDVKQHKYKVSIAVGQKNGAYYSYAKKYQKALKKYDVQLNIITTNGAIETQEKLINNEVDFAFVQGGLEQINKGLLALANVAHEPIWVLYKEKNIRQFEDLKGKRINVCNPRSGTRPIAEQLLVELLDMKSKELKHYDIEVAYQMLLHDELDALFYIIARSSPSLQKKINNPNIHIMNFPQAESIHKFFIKDDMNASKNSYFKTIVLKQNSISFKNRMPREDTVLLVKRTILVTKNTSDEMVRLFLKIANKVHSKEAFFHDENHFINTHGLKYEQHEASKRYFETRDHRYEQSKLINMFDEHTSYWLAQTLRKIEDRILLFIVPLALIGFFIEVIYPLFKFYTRRKINSWYTKINKLDTNMEHFPLEKLRSTKEELELIAIEMYNTDNIKAIHLEAYYALQQQVKDMIENFEKRIEEKSHKEILV